jgi:hypothetical protein
VKKIEEEKQKIIEEKARKDIIEETKDDVVAHYTKLTQEELWNASSRMLENHLEECYSFEEFPMKPEDCDFSIEEIKTAIPESLWEEFFYQQKVHRIILLKRETEVEAETIHDIQDKCKETTTNVKKLKIASEERKKVLANILEKNHFPRALICLVQEYFIFPNYLYNIVCARIPVDVLPHWSHYYNSLLNQNCKVYMEESCEDGADDELTIRIAQLDEKQEQVDHRFVFFIEADDGSCRVEFGNYHWKDTK